MVLTVTIVMTSWEKYKFSFTGDNEAKLSLPTALEYTMTKHGTFEAFAAAQGNSRRTIKLSVEEMRDFFDRVIEPICDRIDIMDKDLSKSQQKPSSTCKFLTGGLASNEYFQKRMKERYPFTLHDGIYARNLAVGK
jgi:hypothetical protein